MKKLIALSLFIGGLVFLTVKVKAGAPLDSFGQTRTTVVIPANSTKDPYATTYAPTGMWNTLISSSSFGGTTASIVLPVVTATFTYNGGVSNSTITARNCITDLFVSLGNNATFYLLDGGTTNYVVTPTSILTSSANSAGSWTKHWDHNGPWCGTAGNTTTLQTVGSSLSNSISVDGYTAFTGGLSVYNSNQ